MGQIITFYSYKGGTGRTMALANVAWLLASNGNRVLVVDWDLEAPGLHRYLAPFLTDRGLEDSRGVIDVMLDFARQAVTPGERKEKWYSKLAKIDRLAASVNWNFPPARDANGNEIRGYLEFIGAGLQNATYATRVNSFNWDNFYERLGGGGFIDEIRENLHEAYDYVLLDSRTGVSDTAGICTVQMPDKVVVCFTLNNQSIEGASLAARAILDQHGGAAGRFPVFPVPTRVDYSEDERLNLRRDYAQRRFADFLTFLPAGVPAEQYWNEVEVPYRALYAYEELLTPFGDKLNDPKSVLAAFERIAGYITGTGQRLKEMDGREQDRVRREFAGVPAIAGAAEAGAGVSPPEPTTAEAHQDIYFSFHTGDAAKVQTIRDRLRASGHDGVSGPSFESSRSWGEEVPKALERVRRFVYFIGPSGLTAWQRRELAFATKEWKQARGIGGDFEIVPVLLPQTTGADLPTEFLMANAVDFRPGIESRPAWDKMVRLLRSEISSYPRGVVKGDLPYDEGDAAVLPGRDDEIRELGALLMERPRVVRLRGDSGCGKTSLLEAGLIPHIRRQTDPRWEIVSVRPGADPFVALAEAMQPLLRTGSGADRVTHTLQLGASLATGSFTIDSVLLLALRESPGARILLVLDQAEELFTLTREAQRIQFVKGLAAMPPALPVTLLMALRPDWETKAEELMPRLRETPAMTLHPLGPGWIDRTVARRRQQGEDVTREAVVDEILEGALDTARDRRLIALSRLASGDVRVADLDEETLRTLDPFLNNGLVSARVAPDSRDNVLHLEGQGQALREFLRDNAAALAWRMEVRRAAASGMTPPPALADSWIRFLNAGERVHLRGEPSGDAGAQKKIAASGQVIFEAPAAPALGASSSAPSPLALRTVRETRWPVVALAAMLTLLLSAAAWWVLRPGLSDDEPVKSQPVDTILIAHAEAALGRGNPEEALRLYTQWIERGPSAKAYEGRGRAYLSTGHYDLAEKDFTSALGFDSSNAKLFAMRSVAQFELKGMKAAREDLLEAVKLDPRGTAALPEIQKRTELADQVKVASMGVSALRRSVAGMVAYDAQREPLAKVFNELKTRGYDVSAVQTVGPEAPARSELRYWSSQAQEEAIKLADFLRDQGVEVQPTQGKGRKSADFEIWLAARPAPRVSQPGY